LDDVYLCLDCTREAVATAAAGGHSLMLEPGAPSLKKAAWCGDCGVPLPESTKRQLKADNLVLRTLLAETKDEREDALYNAGLANRISDRYAAQAVKATEIATEAIQALHAAQTWRRWPGRIRYQGFTGRPQGSDVDSGR
jgi:hypothetical protein